MKKPEDEYLPGSALEDVAGTQARSREIHQYSLSAPYLVLAGGLWLVVDVTLHFTGVDVWGWAAPLSLPLFAAILLRQARRRSGGWDSRSRRAMVVWAILGFLVVGSLTVFSPAPMTEVHAFFGLLVGAGFALVGTFLGKRLALVGAAMMILSLVAFVWIDTYYALFMGLVGGGGMILGGIWLKRV